MLGEAAPVPELSCGRRYLALLDEGSSLGRLERQYVSSEIGEFLDRDGGGHKVGPKPALLGWAFPFQSAYHGVLGDHDALRRCRKRTLWTRRSDTQSSRETRESRGRTGSTNHGGRRSSGNASRIGSVQRKRSSRELASSAAM